MEGDPLANHRVTFHDGIKDYEDDLVDRIGRTDVSLHSYVISQPSFRELRDRSRVDGRDGFHDEGIYSPDGGIEPIIQDVLP